MDIKSLRPCRTPNRQPVAQKERNIVDDIEETALAHVRQKPAALPKMWQADDVPEDLASRNQSFAPKAGVDGKIDARATILHVITGLNTGGAETTLSKLLSTMDRARFNSVVLSLRPGGAVRPRIEALGIPVLDLGLRNAPGPSTFVRLFRILGEVRPDLIQGWMYHGNLAASVAGALSRKPVLWNVRCASVREVARSSRSSSLAICLSRMFSMHPDTIVYVAQSAAREHAELGFSPARSLVIPNGFDCSRFQPNPEARASVRAELGIGPETPLVGIVARYDPMKDIPTFIRAAGCLAKQDPRVRFLMIGNQLDRDNSALTKLATEAQVLGRLHLLGERQDIPRLLAALDVFSLSSIGEGFPVSVGEAMASGVPCVITDVGDSGYLVGESGLAVPPRDPIAMSDVWRELLGDSDRHKALADLARRRILEHFDLLSIAQQYERLYREIVQGRTGTPNARLG